MLIPFGVRFAVSTVVASTLVYFGTPCCSSISVIWGMFGLWGLLKHAGFFAVAKPTSRGRDRSLSFMSATLAKGAFPKDLNVPNFPIHGVLVFETLPAVDTLKQLLTESYLCYDRFRSIPVQQPNGQYMWQEVEVDLSEHIVEVEFETQAEVDAYLETILIQAMPATRPLWDFHLIKNGSGDSWVVPRVDHAIGDGLSLVRVFLGLFKDTEGKPMTMDAFKRRSKTPSGSGPPSLGARLSSALSMAGKVFSSLGKVLAMPAAAADSPTLFRDTTMPYVYTGRRRCVTSEQFDLATVKAIKTAHSATVNDVLSACVTGAVRRYLEHREDPALAAASAAAPLKMRALLPYAFPQRSKTLTNRWCFVSLDMPIQLPSAAVAERLAAVKASCDALKSSPEALVQLKVQAAAAKVLPQWAQAQTALDVMTKHSMVFTNVPAPPAPVTMGGEAVKDIFTAIGNVVPQVSVISYAGKLRMTWVVDDAVVSTPQLLPQFFMEELNALAAL